MDTRKTPVNPSQTSAVDEENADIFFAQVRSLPLLRQGWHGVDGTADDVAVREP